jgi:hypothetical protein
MFSEVFLPHIEEVTRSFELTFCGCCEWLDDHLPLVEKAIPNLCAIVVSGWRKCGRATRLLLHADTGLHQPRGRTGTY